MYKRKVLEKIKLFLDKKDILLFYGARQVWKTSLMKYIRDEYFKDNSVFIDLEKPQNLELLNGDPDIFINHLKLYNNWNEIDKITIFIDEIQYLENPTSFLKYIYDSFSNIKFIISWSSTLEIRWKLKDSLVGRIIKFDILPLSFEEFLIFKWKDNLSKIVWEKINSFYINDEIRFFYEEYLKFWWYPKIALSDNIELKKEYLKQIYSNYIEKDIKDIWKIKELEKFNRLIRLLANQSWNLLNLSEISNTVWINIKTLNEWLFLLENTFVIKLIYPFSNNLRWELTKMPKLFFIDNGIRNFCEDNYEIVWNSFENIFFNYINNSYKSNKINFYRTQDKKEIDFVIDSVPYELKISYNWKKLTSLNYFEKKYYKRWNVVTLKKMENDSYDVFYPWEV